MITHVTVQCGACNECFSINVTVISGPAYDLPEIYETCPHCGTECNHPVIQCKYSK